MLVNARLVAEGIGAHDGLVGLHLQTREVGYETAGPHELRGIDVGGQPDQVAARPDGHHDLLQGGVASPLADAVDSALYLTGPGPDGRQAVGHRQAQVVVAVHSDHRLVDVGHILQDAADEGLELVRDGVAHGVGDVDGGSAGVDALLHQLVDVVGVGAGSIHGGELHVGAVLRRPGHHGAAHLPHLLLVFHQLVHEVDVGGGEEDVDARLGGVANRLPAGVHVARHGARQAGDD